MQGKRIMEKYVSAKYFQFSIQLVNLLKEGYLLRSIFFIFLENIILLVTFCNFEKKNVFLATLQNISSREKRHNDI